MSFAIFPIHGFADNLFWVISDIHNHAIVIDPGDASAVKNTLSNLSLTLDAILITHHHWDHTGGISGLVDTYNVPVYGPQSSQIPMITHCVNEGDQISFFKESELTLQIIETPGHTSEDISYYGVINDNTVLFCGDTLFGAGCGRVLGGSYQQLYHSLQRIQRLPAQTNVYCAHEFTLSNLNFATIVEPDNDAIKERIIQDNIKRQKNQATVPFTLEKERQTNPFLRLGMRCIQDRVNEFWQQHWQKEDEIFTGLRRWKDMHKG